MLEELQHRADKIYDMIFLPLHIGPPLTAHMTDNSIKTGSRKLKNITSRKKSAKKVPFQVKLYRIKKHVSRSKTQTQLKRVSFNTQRKEKRYVPRTLIWVSKTDTDTACPTRHLLQKLYRLTWKTQVSMLESDLDMDSNPECLTPALEII